MDFRKILGILFIILGLIFIVYPMYSASVVSLVVGFCLITFGFAELISGFYTWSIIRYIAVSKMILAIIAIMLGIMFLYEIDALSFLVGFKFYIIAFVMIFVGILGLVMESTLSKLASILILIMGVIAVFLALYSIAEPLYATILVGICLILDGICFVIE